MNEKYNILRFLQVQMNLFLLVALMAASSWLVATSEAKIVWRVRPQEYQIAKEYDNVKLNCEFENSDPSDKSTNYFVIWYKDGSSQNFISLNNQLANLNANDTYEIVGKYSLIVKNVTRNNSGIYTCQLFQSNELISSVNLTVLGKSFLSTSSPTGQTLFFINISHSSALLELLFIQLLLIQIIIKTLF